MDIQAYSIKVGCNVMDKQMGRIRPAEKSDVKRIVRLWEQTRPYGQISRRKLEAFFSASPFFIPEAALVAEDEADLVGFIVATVREKTGGPIPLLFFAPEYLDSDLPDRLLGQILRFFVDRGASSAEAGTSWETGLSDCGYDTRYTDTIDVFSRNGFRRVWSDDELDLDNHMSILVHLEPPIRHPVSLLTVSNEARKKSEGIQNRWTSETLYSFKVAPQTRSSGGRH